MARYMATQTIVLETPRNSTPRAYGVGDVIDMPDDFRPSNCMIPLDAAAKAARARVMAKRNGDQRYWLDKRAAWFRRGLTQSKLRLVAEAEAAMEAKHA